MAGTENAGRPRVFEPALADSLPAPRTPGWDLGPERRVDDGRTLARGLGWFSIGLGVAELLAPDHLTRFLGVADDRRGLVRAYGMREIASGVAILAQRTPTVGVWSRVVGDVADLGTLGAALGGGAHRGRTAGAMAAVAGVTALDILCAKQLSGRDD